MKQTIAMKQAAFEELMREHGFQYLGATTSITARNGNQKRDIPAPGSSLTQT